MSAAEQQHQAVVAPLYFGPSRMLPRIVGDVNHPTPSERVTLLCAEFCNKVLPVIEPSVIGLCHSAITHNFVSAEDRTAITTHIRRIQNFVVALLTAIQEEHHIPKLVLPPKPKLEHLARASSWSAEEERRRQARLANIANKKALLAKEREKLAQLERDIADELAKLAARRKEIEDRLSGVRPMLDAALAGLAAVKEEHLWEARSYQTPPPMVHKVMSSVLTVLGIKGADKWDVIRVRMQSKDFIPSLRDFNVDSVQPQTLNDLKRFVNDPEYTEDNAEHASRACAPLVRWVTAITKYAEVFASVAPLLAELDRLQSAELGPKERAAADQRLLIRRLEKEVADMEAAYRNIFNDAELHARDADAQAAIDSRNALKLAEWEDRCAAARAIHTRRVSEILSKPPDIDEEAKRISRLAQARCAEILQAIARSYSNVKFPGAEDARIIAEMASEPIELSKSRAKSSSASPARSARGAPSSPPRSPAGPNSTSDFRSPPPKLTVFERLSSSTPHQRSLTPVARRSLSRPVSPQSGRRSTSRGGTPSAQRVRGQSPASSSTPRLVVRSPLSQPKPGSAYRGGAVERYYLAVSRGIVSPAPGVPAYRTTTTTTSATNQAAAAGSTLVFTDSSAMSSPRSADSRRKTATPLYDF